MWCDGAKALAIIRRAERATWENPAWVELFSKLGDVDKACESCHLHYWYPNDIRAREAAKEDGVVD